MSDIARPSSGSAQAAEPLRLLLGGSATRALALLVALSAVETAIRTLRGAANFPSVATALVELVTRTSRLLAFTPVIIAIDLCLTLLGRWLPLRRLAESAFDVAARPGVILRTTVLVALSAVVFARTVALDFQLRWVVGIAMALSGVPLLLVLEWVWAWRRGRPRSGGSNLPGRFFWAAVAVTSVSLLADLLGQPELSAAAGALLAAALCHGALGSRALHPWALVVTCLATAAGLCLDVANPSVRRFASMHAPFSNLALRGLQGLTDLDGDGSSGVFGLDCNDLDPSRSPAEPDLPDDGLDQNCTGKDSTLDRTLAELGPAGLRAKRDPAPLESRPPVFLITVDGLRADVFDDGSAMPRTLGWAKNCLRFSNARSAATSTADSLMALHSGMFPRHVDANDRWLVALADPKHKRLSTPPTLAAMLAAADYATYVVFPPFHSDNFFFLTGYELGGTLPGTGSGMFPSLERTLERARAHIGEAREPRPLHLRAHLMDLHVPYREGAGHRGYLRSASAIDEELARFLLELPRESVVVLTADHGEAFGEHGTYTHGRGLFDEELHVPLVLCAPPRFGLGAPRTIDTLVSLVDVTPTVADLLGLAATYPWHGQSLVPHLRRGSALPRPWAFAERWGVGRRTQAIVAGCTKLIQDLDAGWEARFDVCADPRERVDLAPGPRDPTRALLGAVVDAELDAFRSWRVGRRPTMVP